MPKTLDFNKLVENAQKSEVKKKKFEPDQRYFQIEVDKNEGNFTGVIRFLSPREEDDTFFLGMWTVDNGEEGGRRWKEGGGYYLPYHTYSGV